MLRNILIVLFFFSVGIGSLHALISYTKPTSEEINAATNNCLETGKSEDEEKYICPDGEMLNQLQSYGSSGEVLRCAMKMSLSFHAIDEVAKDWAEELQKQREPDFNVWSEDIEMTFDELKDTYYSVCAITNWTLKENPEDSACAVTTDFFPETACHSLARQKAMVWKNTGYMIAAKGIAKFYQNEKDVFVDKKKTKYSELVNKWNSYKRIFANAVAKIKSGKFIVSPVK